MNHVVPEQPVMLALVVCPIYMAARSGYAIVLDLAATDLWTLDKERQRTPTNKAVQHAETSN